MTRARPRFRSLSVSGLVTSALKFCCVLVCVCVSENFIAFWKRLLCIMKIPCVLEKIVVFPNQLLCSRKDCCVLQKIVVF